MKPILSVADKIKLIPLWIITLLPISVLYILSDILYVLIYHVVRYRRKVVYLNLTRAFPEKKPDEIKRIAIGFYRYLCDYFIESIYLLNMSSSECNRRYRYINLDLLDDLASKKRNIILAVCHYGNWYGLITSTIFRLIRYSGSKTSF
jgi:KDO2-lipid IV(A) lauroyltransferase